MRKDKSTKMEDKYWEGISSLGEEKVLKTQADEPYFHGLNELSNEKMDLEFGRFMEMVEGSEKTAKRTKKKNMLLYVAYGAAAIALFVAGLFFLQSTERTKESYQQPQFSAVRVAPKTVEVQQDSAVNDPPSYAAIDTKHTREKKYKKSIAKPKTTLLLEEEPADESYVIVNGQPVYDQEEAEQIVLASLKIMASNFQEGKHALEKVKYINVEL